MRSDDPAPQMHCHLGSSQACWARLAVSLGQLSLIARELLRQQHNGEAVKGIVSSSTGGADPPAQAFSQQPGKQPVRNALAIGAVDGIRGQKVFFRASAGELHAALAEPHSPVCHCGAHQYGPK